MRRLISIHLLAALAFAFPLSAAAIGTTLTYQGTLEDAGVPANGAYDLQFILLDATDTPVAGAPVLVLQDVSVTKGVFTVQLDFGASAFDGADRRLGIGVRPGPSVNAFTALNPPTALSPTPYAQVSEAAEVAASVANDTVHSAKIVDGSVGGVDINPAQVQRRVSGTCGVGSAMRVVNDDGTVSCQATGAAGLTLPFATTENQAGAVFSIANNGDGTAIEGTSNSSASSVSAVRGVISSTAPGGFSSAVRGVNNGTGGLGVGIYGSQAGSGWGVYGVTPNGIGVYGNSSGGGFGLYANSQSGTGLQATSNNGVAANISILNNANTNPALQASTVGTGPVALLSNTNNSNVSNTLEVVSSSNGNIPDNTQGNVASFVNSNTNSVSAAVRGEVNTIFGNFGAAGVFGVSKGTGGFAGLFHASNANGNGAAVVALTDGNGNAITANASKDGNAIEANIDGAGNALYAWVPSFATGRAARFNNFNDSNTSDLVTATTVGNGIAVNAKVDLITGTKAALRGEVNSQFSNFGTAGVFGISSGTGGFAGLFHASNPAGNGPALIAIADGNGNGITANAANNGDGVETTVDGAGNALYAWTPSFATGRAARLVNFNDANVNPVLTVEQHSAGSIALFKAGDPGTVNVARINAAGKGFFNGGTQTGGADLAEVVDTAGAEPQPGDVVEIDPTAASRFRLSQSVASTLVAGVITTNPGVLMNAPGADPAQEMHGPALALAGRVPVKASAENGAIRAGDLLVSASIPGHAMRAPPYPAVGSVIGKALEPLEADTGLVEMLVMLR